MPDENIHIDSLKENFDDFFDEALSGFLISNSNGQIIRANKVLGKWVGIDANNFVGKSVSDLVTIGGKIYYETHLWPLLRMQGQFDEVALELVCANQQKLPVFINGLERKNKSGVTEFIRFTIFKATDRRMYEQNLKESKAGLELSLSNAVQVATLRDQFISILGHDLRNPLGSIISATGLLSRTPHTEQENKLIQIIDRSSTRMRELVNNIMDFARSRLGESIIVNPQQTELEIVLQHVVDELRLIYPSTQIEANFEIEHPVVCDGPRIAQLFSNLLANAITHGHHHTAVIVNARTTNAAFELEVSNGGDPIPQNLIGRIFEPFTREEFKPSQSGLGLGLYIVSQIAKAHKGQMVVFSNEEKTSFKLILPQNF